MPIHPVSPQSASQWKKGFLPPDNKRRGRVISRDPSGMRAIQFNVPRHHLSLDLQVSDLRKIAPADSAQPPRDSGVLGCHARRVFPTPAEPFPEADGRHRVNIYPSQAAERQTEAVGAVEDVQSLLAELAVGSSDAWLCWTLQRLVCDQD